MVDLSNLGVITAQFLAELKKVNMNLEIEFHVDERTHQSLENQIYYAKNRYTVETDHYQSVTKICGVPVKVLGEVK